TPSPSTTGPRRTTSTSSSGACRGRDGETMAYEQILYEVDGGVLTITLNRPEKLNAFTPTMMRELIDAFDRADTDDAVRAVIVTGAGRAFCAGADLSGGGGTFDNTARDTLETHRDGGGLGALRIYESKKPVIAALNGPAGGGGVTMTLPVAALLAHARRGPSHGSAQGGLEGHLLDGRRRGRARGRCRLPREASRPVHAAAERGHAAVLSVVAAAAVQMTARVRAVAVAAPQSSR